MFVSNFGQSLFSDSPKHTDYCWLESFSWGNSNHIKLNKIILCFLCESLSNNQEVLVTRWNVRTAAVSASLMTLNKKVMYHPWATRCFHKHFFKGKNVDWFLSTLGNVFYKHYITIHQWWLTAKQYFVFWCDKILNMYEQLLKYLFQWHWLYYLQGLKSIWLSIGGHQR